MIKKIFKSILRYMIFYVLDHADKLAQAGALVMMGQEYR